MNRLGRAQRERTNKQVEADFFLSLLDGVEDLVPHKRKYSRYCFCAAVYNICNG